MSEQAAEEPLIKKTADRPSLHGRPWQWVSYDDPAWPLEPWEAMNDEDLADAAVRWAVGYLRATIENMTILRAAHLVEQAAPRVVSDIAAEARTRNYSWGRIAEEFEVGRTAAQKRFGGWPGPGRAKQLEDQYQWMCDYLRAADQSTDTHAYADWEYAIETRRNCIQRRRGHYSDPLDTVHKVVRRQRKRRSQDEDLGTAERQTE